jgi:uracil-DNA glycosylase
LHDRPLDQAGEEMMGKIVFAMGKTPETAPVIIEHPVPNARAYVVLGARALKKFFPENKAEPGQWIKSALGKDVLVTYSPAFLLRFPVVTKSVQKMKHDMWLNLKDLARRLK